MPSGWVGDDRRLEPVSAAPSLDLGRISPQFHTWSSPPATTITSPVISSTGIVAPSTRLGFVSRLRSYKPTNAGGPSPAQDQSSSYGMNGSGTPARVHEDRGEPTSPSGPGPTLAHTTCGAANATTASTRESPAESNSAASPPLLVPTTATRSKFAARASTSGRKSPAAPHRSRTAGLARRTSGSTRPPHLARRSRWHGARRWSRSNRPAPARPSGHRRRAPPRHRRDCSAAAHAPRPYGGAYRGSRADSERAIPSSASTTNVSLGLHRLLQASLPSGRRRPARPWSQSNGGVAVRDGSCDCAVGAVVGQARGHRLERRGIRRRAAHDCDDSAHGADEPSPAC